MTSPSSAWRALSGKAPAARASARLSQKKAARSSSSGVAPTRLGSSAVPVVMTMSASSTASRTEDAACVGSESEVNMRMERASARAWSGSKTRTCASERTSRRHLRWMAACGPAPIRATRVASGRASTSAASAPTTAVRMVVRWPASIITSSSPVSRSNSWM